MLYGYAERSCYRGIIENVVGYFENVSQQSAHGAVHGHRAVDIHKIFAEVDIIVDQRIIEFFDLYLIERSVDEVVFE